MKEIISAVLFVVSLFMGTHYLKEIHDYVRQAALEKAAHGLPSLVEMNKRITGERPVNKMASLKKGGAKGRKSTP